MNDTAWKTDSQRLNRAMSLRRWFLILAAPCVLILTIVSMLQWCEVWQWLIR